MTDLKQTLSILDVKVPQVPVLVEDIGQLAAGYHKAVQDYFDRLDAKKAKIDALREQVDDVLERLKTAVAEERPILEGGRKQVETAVDTAREELQESRDQLEEKLEAAGGAASELKSHLEEGAERVSAAQQEAAGHMAALRGQLTSSQSELDMFVDTASDTSDGVEIAVDEAKQQVLAGLSELGEQMATFLNEHVTGRLDATVERLEGMASGHAEELDAVMGALEEGTRGLGEKASERLEEEVTDKVSSLVESAAESYVELQVAHGEARQAGSDDREMAGQTAAAVMEWVQPLEQAVLQVQEAARVVGTDWPA